MTIFFRTASCSKLKKNVLMLGYISSYIRQTALTTNLRYRHIIHRMASGSSANTGANIAIGNKLQDAKSPYLLQHATNPVNWYPWGSEALDKAKQENKIIFLSVGYSTCHWCHVMEKESFEDNEVAKIMNKYFISVKVDREERPDIDKVYMTYVQATTGSGGWPMSVWLTPDLKPIYGGTYFPPSDNYLNQPSFTTVLIGIAKQWDEDKTRIEQSGNIIVDAILKENSHLVKSEAIPSSSYIHKAYQQLSNTFDAKFGGFKTAPKFPQPVNIKFLLNLYNSKPNSAEGKRSLEMCLHTLKMMSKGGIHDHICQGFHRYSTDNEWHVPHFEKMLYDQGQLAEVYTDAYQITKDALFKEIAYDILTYVSRDLGDKSGGFYSAEDADSLPTHDAREKKEGAFCVWTKAELIQLLNTPVDGKRGVMLYDVFCEYYNVKETGNVDPRKDPHNELKNQNVLCTPKSLHEVAKSLKMDAETVEKSLTKARDVLSKKRSERPKPHLDNKMIAAWNGLMITAFAKAGQVFGDDSLIARAASAATFLETKLYDQTWKILRRSCYVDLTGEVVHHGSSLNGYSEDYVFTIDGLLNLFEATGDVKWLDLAITLQEHLDQSFWDEEQGGYFQTDGKDSSVILRLKDDQDGAQPSSNSIAVMNLLRLSELLSNSDMRTRAENIFKIFNMQLKALPLSLPLLLSGLILFQSTWKRVIIVGDKTASTTSSLIRTSRSLYMPNKVIVLVDSSKDHPLYEKIGVNDQIKAAANTPTAFVCRGKTCTLPVTTPDKFEELLKE
uniref:Spermatogenesis-associated protein 20-like TRX domain-containing protein n=1 Tax=Strigamia maritima TaxID=126957 RepID=T1JDB8_STRMM